MGQSPAGAGVYRGNLGPISRYRDIEIWSISRQFRGKNDEFRGNFAVEMTDFAVKMTVFAIISRQIYTFVYFAGLLSFFRGSF